MGGPLSSTGTGHAFRENISGFLKYEGRPDARREALWEADLSAFVEE